MSWATVAGESLQTRPARPLTPEEIEYLDHLWRRFRADEAFARRMTWKRKKPFLPRSVLAAGRRALGRVYRVGAPSPSASRGGTTGRPLSGAETATSAGWRRAGVFASVVLAALWAATCGDGGGGDPGPVAPPPAPNQPPAATGTIPARTLVAGESASVSVASFFSDPNGDALTYTATSSNTAVATVSVSGGTTTIQAVAEGTATVTVTARDPGGLSASQTMSVVVEPANAAPEVVRAINRQFIYAGDAAWVNLFPYFSDPDGDSLTYAAATSDERVVAVVIQEGTATVLGIGAGTATVLVTARDPGGLEVMQGFEVVVERAERRPEPVDVITPRGVRVGETTSLDVSSYFRDPDGDALTYTATTGTASVATASASGSVVTITAVAPGVTAVAVTARDPGGLEATQEFRVAVDLVNRAPEAEGTIPAHRLVVGETGFLNVRSYLSDPDGDALTYAVSTSAVAVARVSVSGGLMTIFGVAPGAATVSVTARDPGGLEAAQRFEVTVRTPNRAPEPEGMIPAQTVSEGGTTTVDAASYFSEPDGEQLSYAVASSNARVATALVTGSAVTITGVARGTAQVTVTARDSDGLVATQRFWVTVDAVNQPPAAVGTVPAQTVQSGRTVWVSVHSHFRDPDGDPLEYTVATSDAGVARATAAGSIVTLTGVSQGTATITVTGRDRGGLEVTQAFVVTVPNGSPRAEGTISEQTLDAGEAATVDVSSYFADPDGDALSFAVASGNENVATASLSGSTLTVTAVARGLTSVTVTARDPEGLEATQRAWVTVAQGNQAPVASGTIADRTIDPGRRTFVNLFAYFSDPDFDALSYEAATSDPAAVTVSVSGSTAWLEAVARGTATMTVTASDPDGLEATQQFMVEVANGAPEAVGSIPDTTMNVGESFTVDLSAYFTDPDGDQLAYEAEAFFDRVATVSVSGSVLTITGEGKGSTSITVTARDPDGEEARQRTRVEVIQPNRPPQASDVIPDQTVDQHRTAWFLAFAYFRDPDFDRLEYTAVSSNESVATVEVSRSTVRITGVEPGTVTVTVTASDPDGLEASQQVGVTVNRVNRRPEAVGEIPDRTINVGESFTVDVSPYFTDPDGDALEYEADAFFDNVASVSMSGTVMTVTALSDFAGGTTVTVTARDPDGEEARQRTRVDVIQLNRPPEVTDQIPDQTVDQRRTVWFFASSYFEDPDRDRLEYTAVSSNESVATVEVSRSTVRITGVEPGTATVTVTATDPDGLQASQEVGVTVNRVNRRPEAVGEIPERTINVGESFTLDVSPYFSDPDGDPLEYEADALFDNVASVSMSGSVMTVTALSDFAGGTSITVTARDPDGAEARQRTRVTVESVNRPPEAVGSIPAESITVGATARVFVRSYFRDPDGDRLEYSVASSNSGVATATVSGTIVSITGVAEGNATVTVTASDPDGLTATQEIGVSVGAVNQHPETVGTIPEQTVNVGSRVTVDVARYFRDPDGDRLEYEAETFFTNRATVSMSGSVMTITGVGEGSTSLTVTASDPGGLEARQRTRVTVQAVNGAPQAVGSIPNQTIDEGRSVTVQTHSYFRDPDSDRLSYQVATSSARVATASVTSGGVVTISGVAAGSATVTVTASDPDGLEARQTIGVTVTSSNGQPRTRGSIPGQTLDVGATATVDVSSYFSDPDQDALSYRASTSNANVATVSVSGSTVTITGAASGTATITVTARDPGGLEATQTMDVGVAGTNEAPETVGSIPSQTISEGASATIDASRYFRDPDGDRLRYSATSSDGSTATVSVSGSTVTIEGVARGMTTITVTASDPDGLRATQQAGVTVRAVNRAPVTSGTISNRTVDVGDTDEVDASSYFHDPDGDGLSYRAASANTGVARASVSGGTVTITGVARGTATITVTARDPGGLEATQSATVSVSSVNEAPAAVGAIPAQSMDVGRQVSLRVTSYFIDPDADPLEYEAATSNDAVATATASGGTVTITGAAEGNAMVTVTARDPSGLTATQQANVAVGAVNQWPAATGTIPDQAVKAGATAQVDLSSYFTDPDGDNLGLRGQLVLGRRGDGLGVGRQDDHLGRGRRQHPDHRDGARSGRAGSHAENPGHGRARQSGTRGRGHDPRRDCHRGRHGHCGRVLLLQRPRRGRADLPGCELRLECRDGFRLGQHGEDKGRQRRDGDHHRDGPRSARPGGHARALGDGRGGQRCAGDPRHDPRPDRPGGRDGDRERVLLLQRPRREYAWLHRRDLEWKRGHGFHLGRGGHDLRRREGHRDPHHHGRRPRRSGSHADHQRNGAQPAARADGDDLRPRPHYGRDGHGECGVLLQRSRRRRTELHSHEFGYERGHGLGVGGCGDDHGRGARHRDGNGEGPRSRRPGSHAADQRFGPADQPTARIRQFDPLPGPGRERDGHRGLGDLLQRPRRRPARLHRLDFGRERRHGLHIRQRGNRHGRDAGNRDLDGHGQRFRRPGGYSGIRCNRAEQPGAGNRGTDCAAPVYHG